MYQACFRNYYLAGRGGANAVPYKIPDDFCCRFHVENVKVFWVRKRCLRIAKIKPRNYFNGSSIAELHLTLEMLSKEIKIFWLIPEKIPLLR